MATLDNRKVLPGGINQPQTTKIIELYREIDFKKFPMAQNDVMYLFDIPAGFVRENTDVFLITPEGATATIDIGVSGATDSFLDGGDINGSAKTLLARGTNYATARVLYNAATTLRLLANNALANAKIRVFVLGYQSNIF